MPPDPTRKLHAKQGIHRGGCLVGVVGRRRGAVEVNLCVLQQPQQPPSTTTTAATDSIRSI